MMKRRSVLGTGAALAGSGLAGCLGDVFGGSDDETADDDGDDANASGDEGFEQMPRVENPPDAVYLPSHQDGMLMLDSLRAGEYAISPMLSIPHFFWNVTGREHEEVTPDGDAIHLMVTVWDPETGVVLPVDTGLTIQLEIDGERLPERAPWPMLSQGMGFHFGDNYPIEGDGEYTAHVEIGAIEGVRLTGELEGRFETSETTSFEFEIDDETRRRLVEAVERLDEDRWGDRDALEPMAHGEHGHEHGVDDDHNHDEGHHGDGEHGGSEHGDLGHPPYSAAPPADELPGQLLGEPTHDDAVYATTLLDPGSRFVDGDERYLAVSPRTPYNRCVLPQLSLSAAIERDGETVADLGPLAETIDHELDLHYGAPVDDVENGDELRLTIEAPPQVARHQGYERAFMSSGELSIEIGGN